MPEVATHVAAAARQLDEAKAVRSAALRDREAAFRLFDAYDHTGAEPVWARALSELTRARAIFASAARELEVALLIDGARDDVRAGLTSTIFDQAVLAELAYDAGATRELSSRLDAFDDKGTLAATWHAPAELSIDAPGAARIDVRAYRDHDGHLELGAPVASAATPRLSAQLAPGSYLIELRGGDGLLVRDPVVVAHGEQLQLAIPLPRAADVPIRADGRAGMVYVPPGHFLVGGGPGWEATRPTFLQTSPLHAVTTGGYLIAITEVTFGDWMTYLRALPDAERENRRPGASALGAGTLRLDGGRRPDEPFVLTLQPTTQALVAREGQLLVYPGRTKRRAIRWEAAPVSWISLEDARAYTAWLASTGRVPGARVCSDLEWERAARGADGRTWAHGERLDPDDANFDETYGRDDLTYGPDEVGMHLASTSPFGLLDTVGNTWELTETPDGQAALRGGGWYHTAASATVANRDLHTTTDRSMWSGLRICATPR
jgi:formylglycine-generating enzyme required for sulfatase activity